MGFGMTAMVPAGDSSWVDSSGGNVGEGYGGAGGGGSPALHEQPGG